MLNSPLAGLPAPESMRIDLEQLNQAYHQRAPDPSDPMQRVAFGTSGHRGTTANGSFTEAHILAITQAICDYREHEGNTGPLLMGKDTHALSDAAHATALRVLLANDVETRIQERDEPTPTPVISHAILEHNRDHPNALADGILITPSHNPPEDGGFKYNPTNGGPADTDVTSWIQNRANDLLENGNRNVKQSGGAHAIATDFHGPYIEGLTSILDMEAIRSSGLRLGVDPLGGASQPLWPRIGERFGLDLTIVNNTIDPTFSFMHVDRDGKIRMDPSSPWAMAGLLELAGQFELAFGCDPDADRHGIVVPKYGLMNPNHFLAVAIDYLIKTRGETWGSRNFGKTIVTSAMIDRVLGAHGRVPYEVPVGFKWFAGGLFDGSLAFGGEESAGASFLRRDGTAWSTDKDGLLMCLLAAEITATTNCNPGEHYAALEAQHGSPCYRRTDAPASHEQKTRLKGLDQSDVTAHELAGDPISAILTRAPGNNAPIGGLKVQTENGWFAARPSGTEDIYKIYAESFRDEAHLKRILDDAQALVDQALSNEA